MKRVRFWAYRSGGSTPIAVKSRLRAVYDKGGACKQVVATMSADTVTTPFSYNNGGGEYVGSFIFEHYVMNPDLIQSVHGAEATYAGHYAYPTLVGADADQPPNMTRNEKSGCPWAGVHVHSMHASTGHATWTRNLGIPKAADCGGDHACSLLYSSPGAQNGPWERKIVWTSYKGE
jgi:hypothetical protein